MDKSNKEATLASSDLAGDEEEKKGAKESCCPKRKKLFWGVLTGIFFLSLVVALFYRGLIPPPGRTNLLLLGMTGEEQAGGDLTDTIIFVSVENQTGKTLAVSLPRDIWIAPIRAKLNSAYHYGGLDLAKATVSEILNQPVNYVVVIDSNLFIKIIEVLGGVRVEVEREFDDYKYPIPGKENDDCGGDPEYRCRYEHLHFDAGWQSMNGERALKYIRSRYAEGEEGTDFARSRRQQRLLLAVKNKLLTPAVLVNPRRLIQLFEVVTESIETDLPREKYSDFIKLTLRLRSKNLRVEVLGEDYLTTPLPSKEKYDNHWVLVPKTGDWVAVQEYVKKLLSE